VKEIVGDLLAIERGIIVHGCNCQGVMGSGVAFLVKQKFPKVFRAYQILHTERNMHLGDIQVCIHAPNVDLTSKYGAWVTNDIPENVIVINAFTQFEYGRDKRHVDYDAIAACFAKVKMIARDTHLPVYFPTIGAGLGGGKWEEIAPKICNALGPDIEATVVRIKS
jgi:O-acetyl-ADP-ribose deacetylase (regulator of RNase III)